MQATLKKEMEEDEELYDKLACWCNTNEYEKGGEISEGEAKINDLTTTIEELTAKSAGLKEAIKALEAQIAKDKEALAEATAINEKELKAFHGEEVQLIQNIENLKAAILVLEKHHGGALPQLSASVTSLLQEPISSGRGSDLEEQFDEVLRREAPPAGQQPPQQKFLQSEDAAADAAAPAQGGWSAEEVAVLRRAMKSAASFAQSRRETGTDLYAPQSGEILGILKQLKDEMTADLSEGQKAEMARAASFAELRTAKETEIEAAEREAEDKEDVLAQTDMDLANAKETLEQTKADLSEKEKFMMNLKKTCGDAEANFALRKKARLEEIKAVSDAINIITADEARDVQARTFKFIQLSAERDGDRDQRHRAATILRAAAGRAKNPELSILATSVELDAFTRVKKAIDDMIATLKQQQEDEVKHKDFCNTELHETEMTTMKTENLKSSLEVSIADQEQTLARLTQELEAAKAAIVELRSSLQGATEERQKANLDFQGTVADQRATRAVLLKALDRLATYYDLLQMGKHARQGDSTTRKQAPPVPQMEYKPNSGASTVMSMIEKLVYETKELEAEAVKGEATAQAQYEALVTDTNSSVEQLFREIASKTDMKAEAVKEKSAAEAELAGAVSELEDLAKYTVDVHTACDFVLKNFDVRQQARQEEIEALQQAKQVLSGADLR